MTDYQRLYQEKLRTVRQALHSLRSGDVILAGGSCAEPGELLSHLHEIDLTGQVCGESVGPRQVSGSAGTFCFAYGAYRAPGGRSILAFTSRTAKGRSRICAMLTPGAVVTIPRNYVDWVVTEYGAENLRGRSLRDRAKALIRLSHPDDRAELTRQAKMIGYL